MPARISGTPGKMLHSIAALGVGALFMAFACLALAAYPEKPIRVILPFPPGGPTDAIGRMLAQQLTTALGQSVVIDNRAGGNSSIGSDLVAKAPADGYTLLFNASIFAINPHLVKLPYDIHRDFTPVALVAKAPLLIAVRPDFPARDVRELIAFAKANPGKLNFGIGSNGSAGHLAQEQLRFGSGIEISMVPYKGSTPAYQDLMGGRIDGLTDPVLGALPLVQGNKVRALAVTSLKRLSVLPDVPTVAESGVPGFEFYSWYGLWGPAGLPAGIVQRLNGEVAKWVSLPEVRAQFDRLGYEGQPGSPAEFDRFVHEDSERSAKIVRAAGIKAE
ncbi:MAG: tripartite tricarboxylate transporter substrate binding protein [Pseudomonadota bacterium]|nr:tripartite tricarboxylate transporter substrate binding protein [Pseudomonadota bacterium]